jgi:hypothetical protein
MMTGKSKYILLGTATTVGGSLLVVKSYADISLADILGWVPMVGVAILGGLFTSLSALEATLSFFDAAAQDTSNSASYER